MNTTLLILLLSGGALPPSQSPSLSLAPNATEVASLVQDDVQVEEASDGVLWYTDIDEARRVAAASGKHVLVSFTGTGWCTWCKKLDAEVLTTPIFSETTLSQFVAVRVDFDRAGDARTDLPFADKNNALKESLGVTGFPTLALMTSTGIDYLQLPYMRGGAAEYVDRLTAAHAEAAHLEVAVPKVVAAIAAAKSKDEATGAANEATQLLSNAGSHALGAALVPIVRATLQNPDLAREREVKAILALAGADVIDETLIDRAFEMDPRNESGLPEAALAAAMRTLSGPSAVNPLIKRIEAMLSTTVVHNRETAAQMYGDCAYWIKTWQQDTDRSRSMASFALSLRPKNVDLLHMLQDLAGQ